MQGTFPDETRPTSLSFLKASGALSADEIAVLRPSDLSLESVLSLADLPIPGFATSSATSFASKPESLGEQKKAGMSVGGKAQEEEEEAKVGVVEFADTDLGATVVECSSNSEASEGILQVISCLLSVALFL